MSFSKEKKFRVTIPDFLNFKDQLLKQGMICLHEPRIINSTYFDTLNFSMYNDSEEGVLPRKKIRVRWYNQEEQFTLEKKISSIEGRFKTTISLGGVSQPSEILNERYIDSQYGIVTPSLSVSYERSYFLFRSMRITFDKNIRYKSKKDSFSRFYQDPERVIEIKIPHNCSDDYIENHVSYSTSRFSKYSRGLLLSDGDLSEC